MDHSLGNSSSRSAEPSRPDPSHRVVSSAGVQHRLQGLQLSAHSSFCYKSQCNVSFVCATHSGSHSMEARCFSELKGWPHCLSVSLLSLLRQVLLRVILSVNLHILGSSMTTEGVVCRSSGFPGGRNYRISHAVESYGSVSHQEVSQGPGVTCLHACYDGTTTRQGFRRQLQGWSKQISEGLQHVFIRESGPDSSIGDINRILLYAIPQSSCICNGS